MKIDAVVVGSLLSARFDMEADTPGFLGTATVRFTTAGQVEIGGTVVMIMPDLGVGSNVQSGWSFKNPSVVFVMPLIGAPSAIASFNASARTLTVTTAGSVMTQQTTQVLRITNVRTPSSVVLANYITVTTQDAIAKVIDTTSTMVVHRLNAGTFSGLRTFNTKIDTPGYKGKAIVSITTSGAIGVGGSIAR